MKTSTQQASGFPEAARNLRAVLEAEAEPSLTFGSATHTAVEALRAAGMFGLIVPAELGGAELDLTTWSETIAELSYADGSLAWTALANSTVAGIASRWLNEEAAKEIFANGSTTALAGQFTPRGTAVADNRGYRVQGKYSFGSGSLHADWIGGGAQQLSGGEPVLTPDGFPSVIGFFVPRDRIELAGNWDSMGLQATGSFDYEVPEQIVGEGFVYFQHEHAQRGRGAASLSIAVIGVAGHAGWALGVGRRAIDEALHAAHKPQTRLTGPNAEREGFLHDIAELEASLQAAQQLMADVFGNLDAKAADEGTLTHIDIARFMQATTYCTRAALNVVRECFEWAGVAAIRPSPLRRCYLDMSVAALHLSQTRESFVGMGRELVAAAKAAATE